MLPVERSSGARQDLRESLEWYVKQSESAALSFDEEVDLAIAKIGADPHLYAIID